MNDRIEAIDDGVWIAGVLTVADIDAAHARGVTTIIDLRDGTEPILDGLRCPEEATEVAKRGMHYVSVPVAPQAVGVSRLAEIERRLAGVAGGTLIHCVSGRRAAVAAVAGRARLRGWSWESCEARIAALGFDLEGMPLLRAALRAYVTRPRTASGARAVVGL
jgi:uncharacterized protein (TIGR01244 family)